MSSASYDILDKAARIGVQARIDGLARNQIENILSSLDLIEDERKSLLVTALFALRQVQRLEEEQKKKEEQRHRSERRSAYLTARLINDALMWLYKSGMGRNQARLLLGLAKWVYEAIGDENRQMIDEAIKMQGGIESLTLDKLLELLRKG